MRLYRIKRKSDGLYLCKHRPRYHHESDYRGNWFNAHGVFWKRIDTVKATINDICSEWYAHWKQSPYNNTGCFREVRLSYHPDRADQYLIEYFDVTVNSLQQIEAKDII